MTSPAPTDRRNGQIPGVGDRPSRAGSQSTGPGWVPARADRRVARADAVSASTSSAVQSSPPVSGRERATPDARPLGGREAAFGSSATRPPLAWGRTARSLRLRDPVDGLRSGAKASIVGLGAGPRVRDVRPSRLAGTLVCSSAAIVTGRNPAVRNEAFPAMALPLPGHPAAARRLPPGAAPHQALHIPTPDPGRGRRRARLRRGMPLPGPQGADPPGRPRIRDPGVQRLHRAAHLQTGRGLVARLRRHAGEALDR